MLQLIKRLYEKKVSSNGLAIFRILFSVNLFFEMLRVYNYEELYYGTLPALEVPLAISIALKIWLVVLVFIAFGFLSKIMTILNYILAVYLLSQFEGLIYHMAYTYLGVSFLMMLFPMSKSFSIDALLRRKFRISNSSDTKVTVLAYYLILLVGLGFVYLDSIFFKFKTDVWMNGVGMWLPASLPHFTILKDQWLLNQKYILYFLGYLTVFFEAIFCFVFFIKKFRIPLLVIGLGLHFGILIEFPIPYFAIGAIGVYMLLVPLKFWEYIPTFSISDNNEGSSKKTLIHTFFKAIYTPVLSTKTQKMGYSFIIILLLIFQFNSTFNFPASYTIEKKVVSLSNKAQPVFNSIKSIKKKGRWLSKHFLGITAHGVFVDNHYIGFDRIFTLSYNEKLIPIYTSEGLPMRYLSGGSWVHYNFRVNRHVLKQTNTNLKNGLSRYAIFYAIEEGLPLENLNFEVKEKKVFYTFHWEKDLLQKNLNEPWIPAGSLKFKNGKSILELNVPFKNE